MRGFRLVVHYFSTFMKSEQAGYLNRSPELVLVGPTRLKMTIDPIMRCLASIEEKAAARLLELEFIVDKLSDIDTPHDARLWQFFSRQRLLQGRTPADLLQQGRVDEVLAAVNQLPHGLHV